MYMAARISTSKALFFWTCIQLALSLGLPPGSGTHSESERKEASLLSQLKLLLALEEIYTNKKVGESRKTP